MRNGLLPVLRATQAAKPLISSNRTLQRVGEHRRGSLGSKGGDLARREGVDQLRRFNERFLKSRNLESALRRVYRLNSAELEKR